MANRLSLLLVVAPATAYGRGSTTPGLGAASNRPDISTQQCHLNSETVRTSEQGGTRGYDGAKEVCGRKRHLLVNTLGLLVVITAVIRSSTPQLDGALGHSLLGCAIRRVVLGRLIRGSRMV